MATITLTVKKGDTPVEGAKVIVGGTIEKELTTDVNGQVTRTVADGFVTVVPIKVTGTGFAMGISGMEFKAGGNYTIDV